MTRYTRINQEQTKAEDLFNMFYDIIAKDNTHEQATEKALNHVKEISKGFEIDPANINFDTIVKQNDERINKTSDIYLYRSTLCGMNVLVSIYGSYGYEIETRCYPITPKAFEKQLAKGIAELNKKYNLHIHREDIPFWHTANVPECFKK